MTMNMEFNFEEGYLLIVKVYIKFNGMWKPNDKKLQRLQRIIKILDINLVHRLFDENPKLSFHMVQSFFIVFSSSFCFIPC